METGSTPVYTDFQSMAALRTEAQARPGQALDEVASQFESLFVQMMLKSMRDATIDGGLFKSDQLDSYQQMFDQQLALDLSSKGGVGLADMMVQQMGDYLLLDGEERGGGGKVSTAIDSADHATNQAQRPVMESFSMHPGKLARASAAGDEPAIAGVDGNLERGDRVEKTAADAAGSWQPESPMQYIKDVWHHATEAAQKLGVDPGVLVAQSALETGWGKKVTAIDSGDSSFNLFNIKAGKSWSGAVAKVSTLEFRDGVAAMEKAVFRAYDSLAESFADYVELLKGSPRYQKALEVAGDSQQFLQELQRAGYATDPGYADKIIGILGQEKYQSVFSTLK